MNFIFNKILFILILLPAVAISADKEPEGMPQLDFSTYPSLIFWLILTFSFTFIMLKYFITPQISDTLEARQNKISSDLEIAKNFRNEAEINRLDQEKSLKESRLEAQKKYKSVIDKIKLKISKDEIILTSQLKPIIDKGEKKILDLRKEVLSKISETSSKIAVEITKKIVNKNIKLAEVKKVVNNNIIKNISEINDKKSK